MNKDTQLYDPAKVKEALAKHFNVPSEGSQLKTEEKHFAASAGNQFHYYLFTLEAGSARHVAFGKLGGDTAREYEALQEMTKKIPEGQRHFSRPIALLKEGNRPMLLLEYLEGYSNAFTLANSLQMFPGLSSNMVNFGRNVLDRIYGLQKNFQFAYSPLLPADTQSTPGQPVPTSVFKQLESIQSLTIETKSAVRDRINAILKSQIPVRRGLLHGQLGMRNIMLKDSEIAFIDWEYMEAKGLCLYDPCYLATMILMRGVQMFIPRLTLDKISDALFQHIESQEDALAGAENKQHVSESVWLAKSLAMIDTLWQYETAASSGAKAFLSQERRKINYLAYCIRNDAWKDKSNSYSVNRWTLHSGHYIKVSQRRSSSAMVTAEKFIETAQIAKGFRILDMGCGHGRIVEIMVEQVPALNVVGVDMTQNLLDNFMVKSGTNDSKIELICGDITKLPLEDNRFDAITSSRVFQYLPDPPKGVREAFRVLKPGGAFVVAIPNKWNPIKYFTYDAALYSPFQVRDWLKASGFEDVECGSMGFFPSSGKLKILANILEFSGKVPLIKYLGGNVLVVGRKKKH